MARGGEEGSTEAPIEEITADRVIMSAGHSARELYDALARKEEGKLALTQKGFAVGFRSVLVCGSCVCVCVCVCACV